MEPDLRPALDKRQRQKLINDTLWKACDTFRGVIDPSSYKDYILAFLFLKYVSDVWADHEAAYRRQYGDEEVVRRKLRYERFVLPEESSFAYLRTQYHHPKLGDAINAAFEQLGEANPGKLDRLFDELDFASEVALGDTRERNRRLQHLLDDFNDPVLDFRPSVVGYEDLIGNAYMYLIARFAADSGKKGGEFYTPYGVSRLLARLLDPQPGQRLYDPTAGSGSLLVAVAEQAVGRDPSAHRNVALYGQELNHRTWALCKMNMFLHGFDAAKIERGNTLAEPRHLVHDRLDRFDVVVANPPFSLDKWPVEAFAADGFGRLAGLRRAGETAADLVPPKSKADFAFVLHMVASMGEAGRAGVVVPNGVLFRGGAEGRIRRRLVEQNLVRVVVSLPEKLFHGTGIPAALILLDRAKTTTDVLFIDASGRFAAGTRQNELLERADGDDAAEGEGGGPDHIGDVVRAARAFASVPGFAHRATAAEVAGNDFNLNVARYVRPVEREADAVDLAALDAEIEALEADLAAVRAELATHLRALGIR